MAEKSWNKNVRFNRNSESAMQAWSLLHSDEVEKEFKSQNEFVICAINDYYERHLRKKRDPYLETREKEDAFVERIVAQAAEKTLANLPTLAGMYLIQQQAVLTAGFQSTVAGANAGCGKYQKENGDSFDCKTKCRYAGNAKPCKWQWKWQN